MKRGKKSTSADDELDLGTALEQVSRDRGLNPDVLIGAIEEALRAAAERYYGSGEELRARFDRRRRVFEVSARKTVVQEAANPLREISLPEALALNPKARLGGHVDLPKDTEAIGRIAAQTAKQVMATRMRDLEADGVFHEYREKIGDVMVGAVRAFEGPDLIVDLGRIEALLPRKEQSPIERYELGDRVKVVLVRAVRNGPFVRLIVSRTAPELLARMLEADVPEIRERGVMIKGVVREAGERSKVAVAPRDRGVDPVGACVGVRGARIQAVIKELRGERIDVVEWSSDPAVFIANALSPARVRKVIIQSESDKVAEVHVDEKQLSLAIGKKGQNVRLASRLTGWRIDITSGARRSDPLSAVFPAPAADETPAAASSETVAEAPSVDNGGPKEEKSFLAEAPNK